MGPPGFEPATFSTEQSEWKCLIIRQSLSFLNLCNDFEAKEKDCADRTDHGEPRPSETQSSIRPMKWIVSVNEVPDPHGLTQTNW